MALIVHKAGWMNAVDPDIVQGYLFDAGSNTEKLSEDDKAAR
jgi:hypothetical protein